MILDCCSPEKGHFMMGTAGCVHGMQQEARVRQACCLGRRPRCDHQVTITHVQGPDPPQSPTAPIAAVATRLTTWSWNDAGIRVVMQRWSVRSEVWQATGGVVETHSTCMQRPTAPPPPPPALLQTYTSP